MLRLGCIALLLGIGVAGGADAAIVRVVRPDSTANLLAIRMDGAEFDVPLLTYPTPRGPLLPLGALAAALELGITVDPASGRARGFLLTQKRSFDLDAARGRIEIGGRPEVLPTDGVELQPDDLYVRMDLLERWLPLDLRVDLPNAALLVFPREPLPMMQRAERRARVAASMLQAGEERPFDGPAARTPYGTWVWDAMDLAASIVRRPAGMGESDWHYAFDAGGDALGLGGRVWLSGERAQPLSSVRAFGGREDPEPVLLGPLRARSFGIGDVALPELDLISPAVSAPGVIVSSFALTEPSEFERRTLRGVLPPGWDAELYRNGALVGYQESDARGVYDFRDVPIAYGRNSLRVVLHGPQGEEHSATQELELGRSLAPPGTRSYRAAIVRDPRDGSTRALAEFNGSTGPATSALIRLSTLGLEGHRQLYLGVGARHAWSRVFTKFDAVTDSAGGAAVQLGAGTRLGAVALWLEHARMERFRSELVPGDLGFLRQRSMLRTDGTLRLGARTRVPLAFEARYETREGPGETIAFAQETSAGARGWSFFHRWDFRRTRARGTSAEAETRGRFLVARSVRGLRLRAEFEYQPQGDAWQVSAETRGPRGTTAVFSFERPVTTRTATLRMRLSPGTGRVAWSLESARTGNRGMEVSLGLRVGLQREPRAGTWSMDAADAGGSGAASVLVFLDQDGDGKRGPAEPVIPGAEVRSPGGRPARADSNGVAVVRGLEANRSVPLRLTTASLDDPLWEPPAPEIAILPRAGRTASVELPVTVSSEIMGKVTRWTPAGPEPVAATVELVQASTGRIVQRAHAALDGSYELAGVSPGAYLLFALVEEGCAQSARGAARALTLATGGQFMEGVDLVTLDGASVRASVSDGGP